MLIYKAVQYTKFQVLMKLEPCIILKLFLNFSNSENLHSYKLYFYKNVCITYEDNVISLQVNADLKVTCIASRKGSTGVLELLIMGLQL